MRLRGAVTMLGLLSALFPFACDTEPAGSGSLPGDVPRVTPPADASEDDGAAADETDGSFIKDAPGDTTDD